MNGNTSASMKFSILFQNRILRAGGIVLAGSVIANFLNYLFNVILGRLLPPAAYGGLVSLVTLLVIVAVPSTTLTMIVAQSAAVSRATGDRDAIARLLGSSLRLSTVIAAGSLVVFLGASPLIASFLHLPLLPVSLFAILASLTFFGASASGLLQGLQEFGHLASMSMLSAGLKLALSVALVSAGFSLGGTMGALVLAAVLSAAYGLWRVRKQTGGHIQGSATGISWRSAFVGKRTVIITTLQANLLLAVFVNADLILAKHYLAPVAAGQYAALAVLGKIVTYGSSAILTVFFPLAAASHSSNDGHLHRYLKLSVAVVAAASAVLTALFWIFPLPVLHLLFGAAYSDAAPFLGYFAAAMGLSSIATVFVYFFLATGARAFLLPMLLCTLGEIAIIAVRHDSIIHIVMASLMASLVLCVLMVSFFVRKAQSPGLPPPEPAPGLS